MVASRIALPVSREWLARAGAAVKRNARSDFASILRRISSAGAITSGPMPSPPSTAMWKALLADLDYLGEPRKNDRHCEGSEAIQLPSVTAKRLDCFVAALLAMTGGL